MLGFEIKTTINDDGKVEISMNNLQDKERPKRIDKGTSIVDVIKDYTIIDIETTGLDPFYNEIIEISALRIRNNEIVDRYDTLVKPRQSFLASEDDTDFHLENGEKLQYIDEFISELTGITNAMLGKAPDISEVLPTFNEFIDNDILIGHNINFDINFLYDKYVEYLQKPLTNNFIDTLRIARKILPELRHHRLDDLIEYFFKEIRNEHRALNDCILTDKIYHSLSKMIVDKYEDIENFKQQFKKKHHATSLKARDIIAENTEFDTEHPLYQKVCVFTGTLEKMPRKEAMQIVANLGGVCGDNVTAQTNYLILGNNDYCKSIKDGKSNKQKKAEKLKMVGQDIEIISENIFYEMIEDD